MLCNDTYDIGLVCLTNLNIGNNLTNYALYQCLTDFNYNVLLIANPRNASYYFPNVGDNRYGLFKECPYPESNVLIPVKSKWELSHINLICDKFVLGSDQLWRDIFIQETDYFTCLEWVESRKYKIAYATSFGIDYFEGNVNMQEKMGYLLKRFQNISVREQGGVKLLKELYKIEAECVLDPVFLCKKVHYMNMAKCGKQRLPKERYVGAYLLDITEKKEKVVEDVASYVSKGIYNVITQPGEQIEKDSRLDILPDPKIEEWLAMIENCDFFLTDSFHGLCFAIIFQKQFCVIFDEENWRGLGRMKSLLDLLQLNDRLAEPYNNQKIVELCNQKIDYTSVNRLLSIQCQKSEIWLKNALESGNDYKGEYDTHDFMWNLCSTLHQKIEEMEYKNYKTRNDLFLLLHNSEKKQISREIIGWGAGECFRRNIHHIKEFYNMQYVCDKDPEKWGKVLEGKVVCIPPEKLSAMKNVMVIIMVYDPAVAFQIAGELSELGLTCFDHVGNWLSFVEGK